MRWWRSERTTAALIPAHGRVIVVTPFFEEPSIRETLKVPAKCGPGRRTTVPSNCSQDACATQAGGSGQPRRRAHDATSSSWTASPGRLARQARRGVPAMNSYGLAGSQIAGGAGADADRQRRHAGGLRYMHARVDAGMQAPTCSNDDRGHRARWAAPTSSRWCCSMRQAHIRMARSSRSRCARGR